MSLLDLPNEMLDKIVDSLDLESLVSFSSLNTRIRELTASRMASIKLSNITTNFLDAIELNGSVVRSLDLSDCAAFSYQIQQLITKCPRIKELNVVNSAIQLRKLLDTLPLLTELETLRFSLGSLPIEPVAEHNMPRITIRNLYIQITPSNSSFDFVIALLNKCESIETLHINMIGWELQDMEDACVPTALKEERWQTLHTVIMSRIYSRSIFHQHLLNRIFAYNLTHPILDWIHEDRALYIYEYGNTNATTGGRINDNENVKFLKKYHYVKLTDNSTRSPWGNPEALAVFGDLYAPRPYSMDIRNILDSLSPSLVEIDLTECHHNYSMDFRSRLIDAAPCLQSVALPMCFVFVSPDPYSHRHKQPQTTIELLQKLTLKKLRLHGQDIHEMNYCEACIPAITPRSFGMLNGLTHLEELTITNGHVGETAYECLANPNVHTVSMQMACWNEFVGLKKFTSACVRMKKFKLIGPKFSIECVNAWKALLAAKSLKQLCVTSGSFGMDLPGLQDVLLQLTKKLDVFHLHASLSSKEVDVFNFLRSLKTEKRHVFAGPDRPAPTPVDYVTEIHSSTGGSICCPKKYFFLL